MRAEGAVSLVIDDIDMQGRARNFSGSVLCQGASPRTPSVGGESLPAGEHNNRYYCILTFFPQNAPARRKSPAADLMHSISADSLRQRVIAAAEQRQFSGHTLTAYRRTLLNLIAWGDGGRTRDRDPSAEIAEEFYEFATRGRSASHHLQVKARAGAAQGARRGEPVCGVPGAEVPDREDGPASKTGFWEVPSSSALRAKAPSKPSVSTSITVP